MNPNFNVSQIEGQENALRYVQYYLKSPSRIPPLLIFYGPEGTGKWSLAERFTFQILCLNKNGCGQCESCKLFFLNQHPDYIVFPSDTRIAIGEEKDPSEFTVRWLLSKRIPYRPHTSHYRIILFPDASLLNNEAETALLKTLEEPPFHTRFIFIVDDLTKLKQTVVSRGVCIPFQYLSKQTIKRVSEREELYTEEFFGGSLNPLGIPSELIEMSLKKIEENYKNPIALMELENWIRNYKDSHPEWEEDFNYHKFLELICLIFLYLYSKDKNYQNLEYIFQFKEQLQLNIPSLENFLLSQLFARLTLSQ